MKTVTAVLLLIAIESTFSGCSTARPIHQSNPFPLGDYQYTAYDKNAAKIVEGTISITSRVSNQVSGDWQLSIIGNAENTGLQGGVGKFEGELDNDVLTVNLHPNIDDWNVILRGKIDDAGFRGKWSFNTYAGDVNGGAFEARKSG